MNFSRFLKYWLPVLLWLGVIFAGSTDIFSAEHTSRYLVPFLHWLNPDIPRATLDATQFAVRKLGHLAEYAILAALLWRALHGATSLRAKMSTLMVEVWVACAIFAASDEFHQSFVTSRTASFDDVLIDICGAFIGLAICFALGTRKNLQKL